MQRLALTAFAEAGPPCIWSRGPRGLSRHVPGNTYFVLVQIGGGAVSGCVGSACSNASGGLASCMLQ